MNPDDEKVKGIKSLVEAVSEITGSATGEVIGFLLGGPTGAAAGGICAQLLRRGIIEIGNDIGERFLSEREKIRIGGVIVYATKKILEKLAAGEKLRTDGFFELPSAEHSACAEIPFVERPPSKEIIEGVLLAVQREHEEMKLPYLGNLFVNILFDQTIDKSHANLLIKLGNTLSFTQLSLLSVFSEPYKSKIKYRFSGNTRFPKSDKNLTSLFQEIFDLGSQGLLLHNGIDRVTRARYLAEPTEIEVTGAAFEAYRLMDLGKIEDAYLNSIAFKIFEQPAPISERQDCSKR